VKNLKSKKWTSIFIALVMVLSVVMPVNVFAEGETETQAKNEKNTKQIDVVFFNDFHGSVKESGKNQGIAKVAGAINAKKAENPNTIVVSAGDNFQGSAMSNLTYGAPVNEFMKSVGVVASAVGNHEFDWGVEKIEKWAEEGGYDFLASNIYDKATGEPVEWAKPYKIVEQDGVKVGFIGLATPETLFKTKAKYVKDLEFRDPVEAAEKWTKVARENGADVVIALTHLGSKQDYETKEITGEVVGLTNIEGIDAIISSHTHQKVCGTVNGVPIVQPYKQGRALGCLSIMVDENGKVTEIEPSIDYLYKRAETMVEDAEVKAIADKYEEEVGPLLSEVLGTTDKELFHDRSVGPSILGEWVCDVMREKAGTQIAVTNGGGLRTSIPAGEITVGNLYEVMPFDNTLVKMELKGSDVKSVIEHGIMNDVIGWIQISGVMVKYNNEGKITSIALEDGTPLDMNEYYTVVTNDFQFSGGDGFDFSGAKNDVNMMIPIRDALVEAVKAEKNLSVEKRECLAQAEESTEKSVYVVKFGDTLGNIAAKFNTTYEEIAKANNVENVALIFPGDKLLIPGNETPEVENVYTVVAGDTLGTIAEMFGMKYEDLAKHNNIENPALIFVGQKISVPAN
jgi:2',3'-cyclic-nucleotide 2'-phosphodiesterase / 3'-nucleotidase / 5'-nucleotidase